MARGQQYDVDMMFVMKASFFNVAFEIAVCLRK